MSTKTRTLWAFGSVRSRYHDRPRQPRRNDRAARDQAAARRRDRHARVDGQRIHADLRRASADRRALGDRFGRRRMFVAGIGIFTVGSATAALAPSIQLLIAARAFQGIGGAIITPLTLTILTGAVPAEKRGAAFGAWSGIQGLAVAVGPLVGGAVTEGISWQWIFWLNVPIGLIALPLARVKLSESCGPNKNIDLPGIGLASAGLLGIVWALVRGNSAGWLSPEITGAAGLGITALIGFIAWELRSPTPMLPMRFFGNRAFAAANAASLAMSFGMFGSVFLLTQFLQLVMGYSPLQAGIRTLAWTAMPLLSRRPRARCLTGSAVARSWPLASLWTRSRSPGSPTTRRWACPTGSCSPRWFWPASGPHRFSPRARTW